jgi:drug/metabolite transporter (DMT)-like permease
VNSSEARSEAKPSEVHQERLGLLFAALCALNSAFVPAIAKLTTGRADPFLVAAATGLFAGAGCAALLAVRGELAELWRPGRWPKLALLGALGTGLAFFLFFAGAERSTAIETALALQVEPAYSLLLSWLALGHRPTLRRLAALAVILAGIGLALGVRTVDASSGIAFLLATPLCWQLSHLLVLRKLPRTPAIVLTGARYVYGGLLLALAYALRGGALPPAGELAALLPVLALQGVVLSMIGTLLWYQTISRLDLGRATAIVVPSIPVLSLGASFLVLGEVATPRQWLGLLLTAAGVLAMVTGPAARARGPR